MAPEFTRARLARLEPMIEAIVARRLDDLAAAGSPADLAEHVSSRVPMDVICELLGLDDADHEAFVRLGTQRFDATGGTAASLGAVSEQKRMLLDVVARQRREPGPGLIGRILEAEGDAISDNDLAGLVDGIVTGGYETTASTISHGHRGAAARPGPRRPRARRHPRRRRPRSVEELLRYLTVVQVAFPRFAKQDLELFGCPVRQGRRRRRLPQRRRPRPRLGRRRNPIGSTPPASPPAAATWRSGTGCTAASGPNSPAWSCASCFPALLRRFPDLALAVPEEQLAWRRLSFVYGVEELPVTF